MTDGLKTIIYPVRDLAQAKALFTAFLGVPPTMDQPYYVGFDIGDQHIGLDPNGHRKGLTGPVAYRDVDDIKATLQTLLDTGAETVQDVQDVGGGMLVASVKDADGNMIGVRQSP